jgi:hypothetical protein
MTRTVRHAVLACYVIGLLLWTRGGVAPAFGASSFAAEIERLSEPEGTFDTDNLISNERSYLDVIPALVSSGVSGGAYIGVGPDQNFSYIARIRPSVAYIIDIRRDNLLLHLLFKALFAHAQNRSAYLCLLTGRSPPPDLAHWNAAAIGDIVAYAESAPPTSPDGVRTLRDHLDTTIRGFGVPLSRSDFATIARFQSAFVDQGLALRFNTHGRLPLPHYPTLRDLLLATDAGGHAWNYLAAEADFQFVKALQARDLVIPVVGDLSGPHAVGAIGGAIAERNESVSAFYISNVESYLRRDGAYRRFIANLNLLPRNTQSVLIRSIFGGSSSISAVQSMNDALAGFK